jgi:hypothetical protein
VVRSCERCNKLHFCQRLAISLHQKGEEIMDDEMVGGMKSVKYMGKINSCKIFVRNYGQRRL